MPKLGLNRQVLANITNNNQEAIAALEKVFSEVDAVLPEQISTAINQAAQAVAAANQALGILADTIDILTSLANAPAPQPVQEFEDMRPAIQLGGISIQEADNVEITGGTIGLSTGTVALPSFYMVERDTGFYRHAANRWGFSVAGVRLVDWLAGIMRLAGVLDINAGSAAAPAIYFGGNTGSGIYQIAANQIGISIAGNKVIDCAAPGVAVTGYLVATGQITSLIAPGTPPFAVNSDSMVPLLYVARAALADNATTANTLTSPSVLPAAATDLPTVINLANALRTAAIAKGL